MKSTHNRTQARRLAAVARDRRNPVLVSTPKPEPPLNNYILKVGAKHYLIEVSQRPDKELRSKYEEAVRKQEAEFTIKQAQRAQGAASRQARRTGEGMSKSAVMAALGALLASGSLMVGKAGQRRFSRQKSG